MAAQRPIRILFVEDVPYDRELAERVLRKEGLIFTSTCVDTRPAFSAALHEFKPDLIISDYSLPEFDGLRALKLTLDHDATLPFIVLTGSLNEETAVACIKAGATDYVLKERIARLPFAVKEALKQKETRSAKEAAEQALRDSEARLAEAMRIAQLANWEYDVATDTFIFNDQFYSILRTTAEREGGYSMSSARYARRFLLPEDAEIVSREVQQAIETTDPHYSRQLDHRIRYADGELGYITVRFRVQKDAQGRTIKTFGANQDITERKRAEEALRISEDRYRLLFETAPVGILSVSPQGQILEINPATLEILGSPSAEATKAINVVTFPPLVQAGFSPDFQKCVESGQPIWGECPYITKWGKPIYFHYRLTPISAANGQTVLVQILMEDITERKRAEEALRESEDKYHKLFSEMFTGAALHEIICDVEGRAVDYVTLEVNHAFELMLNVTREAIVGKKASATLPPEELAHWLEIFGPVALTGQSTHYEIYSPLNRKHFEGSAYSPAPGQFAVTFYDVTARKQHEREMESIAMVATALRAASGRAEMLPVIVHQAFDLLQADGAALLTHASPTSDNLVAFGHGIWAKQTGSRLPANTGATGYVLTTGQVYLNNAVHQEPDALYRDLVGEVQAVVCVPLIAQSQIIGALWVGRQTAITDDEVHLLAAISDIAANALQRAILFEAERDQRTLAESLRDSAAALSSTLNFDEVLDRILVDARRVVPHDSVNVMLVDAERGVARVARHQGYEAYHAETFAGSMEFTIADTPSLKWMASTGRSLIIPDTRHYEGWLDFPEVRRIRSYAGSPLHVKGQLVGFLSFDSATPNFYTSAHLDRMQAFADQAAVAIENAQLYQQVSRHAEELETRVADRTRELAAANERLQELDRLKSKFVSDVSHELRAPIHALNLNVELLDHGKPEKRDYYMQVIRQQVQRQLQLLDDILNLSRLELGADKVQFGPVKVNTLIAQIVGVHAPLAEADNLTLTFVPQRDLPDVRGEENQLAQIFTNVIGNAVNYTSGGQVTVSTRLGDQTVVIEVRDTGLGIDPEDLPHIFERFYRGSRTHEIRGTGLGLAIAKEIAALHNGRIEVESTVGVGTTFRIYLPVWEDSGFDTMKSSK